MEAQLERLMEAQAEVHKVFIGSEREQEVGHGTFSYLEVSERQTSWLLRT